jgi:hypothetical protein
MNLKRISREDWMLAGVALLLVIDLLFLPWFDVSFSAGAFSASATFPATDTPDGWLGLLAVVAALAMIADVGIERLAPDTRIPALGGSRASTRLILAAAAGAFVALKFVLHIHFSIFGFGFYLAVLLTVALVVLAAQARQAAAITPGAVSGG